MHKDNFSILDNYIFIIQPCLYLFFLLILIGHYFFPSQQELISLSTENVLLLFLVFFLISFTLMIPLHVFRWLKRSTLVFAFMLSNLFFIFLLYILTGFEIVKLLFLIPVIIVSLELSRLLNYLLLLIISFGIFISDFLNNMNGTDQYLNDLVIVVVFFSLVLFIKKLIDKGQISREHLLASSKEIIEQEKKLFKLLNDFQLATIIVGSDDQILLINQKALQNLQIDSDLSKEISGSSFTQLIKEKIFSSNCSICKEKLLEDKSDLEDRLVVGEKLLRVQRFPVYDIDHEVVFQVIFLMEIEDFEFTKEKVSQFEEINSLGEMAAGIAHEIKNPLGSIRGFLQLATIQNDCLTNENISFLLEEIERCFTIIAHFLDVTKKEKCSKMLVNLKQIIEEHAILIEKEAQLKGLDFKMYLEDVPNLFLNINQMRQLLLNLTRNGLEAMSGQGVLTIRLINHSDQVVLEVEDTGKGIPEEVLEKLGTPFLTTKEKGTGIGFNLCRHFIEANQATLKIKTQANMGTTITVSFSKNKEDSLAEEV